MERNRLVRLDPARLHEGTRTVIAAAFNYRPVRRSVYFADYAIGADYHYVLKQRLGEAADALCRRFGGSSRIVVDSAPMRERYWAQRAGIGFVADNGMLCVPGYGMAVVQARPCRIHHPQASVCTADAAVRPAPEERSAPTVSSMPADACRILP